jgi:hypothetical protein
MSPRLDCVEYQRLNDIYGRRRCIWLRYAFPLPGQFTEQLDELKQGALLNRDVAAKLMASHQENCPICRAG